MKAADLLKESEYKWILGPKDREFDEIVLDSRKVTEKTAFIAMIGQKTDGHRHIEDAAGKGAALILVAAGFSIRFISNPFTGSTVSLGIFGIPITVLWLVGVSNAVNLIDGMDGLAGGVSAIAAVATAIVCLSQGELVAAALAGILAASALGFLPWNFHPAKTFMGDCGALFMGFILGTLALMGLCKGATAISVFIPFLILGVPVFDTFCAIIRRLFLHKPIFEADKMHLHQVLLSLGLGQRQAVLTIYVFAMLMGLAAVLMAILTSAQAVMVLIITTVATFACAEILGTLRGKCHLSPIKRDKRETA